MVGAHAHPARRADDVRAEGRAVADRRARRVRRPGARWPSRCRSAAPPAPWRRPSSSPATAPRPVAVAHGPRRSSCRPARADAVHAVAHLARDRDPARRRAGARHRRVGTDRQRRAGARPARDRRARRGRRAAAPRRCRTRRTRCCRRWSAAPPWPPRSWPPPCTSPPPTHGRRARRRRLARRVGDAAHAAAAHGRRRPTQTAELLAGLQRPTPTGCARPWPPRATTCTPSSAAWPAWPARDRRGLPRRDRGLPRGADWRASTACSADRRATLDRRRTRDRPSITAVRLTGARHRAELPLLVLGPSLGTSATTLWAARRRRPDRRLRRRRLGPARATATTAPVPDEPFTMAELAAGVLRVVDDILDERGEAAARSPTPATRWAARRPAAAARRARPGSPRRCCCAPARRSATRRCGPAGWPGQRLRAPR